MAVCAVPTVETRRNILMAEKLRKSTHPAILSNPPYVDKRFSSSTAVTSPLAQFILTDLTPLHHRITLFHKILGYTCVSETQANLFVQRNADWVSKTFYKSIFTSSPPGTPKFTGRYGGTATDPDTPSQSSVSFQLNPKALPMSGKKLKKPQKEFKEYSLHRLKLYIRDNFKEKSITCIKNINRDLFTKNHLQIKSLFLECLLNKSMEEVAVAFIDKQTSLFDCPIFGDSAKSTFYPTFFIASVALGREAVVERFLKGKKKHIIADYSWQNIPALVFACLSGNVEIVKKLCHCGADPASFVHINDLARLKGLLSKQISERTLQYSGYKLYAFEVAAARNNLDCLDYLLNKIQRWNVFKNAHFALIVQCNTAVSLVLLKAGVSAGQHNSLGQTGLHFAGMNGNVELICIFITFGLSVESTDYAGNTVLHYAASNRRKEAFHYLVWKGANPNRPNSDGISPLFLALNNGLVKEGEELKMNDDCASEIESTVREIAHNPKFDSLVRLKKGFKLNEKIFGALSKTFNLSKTCPPIKDSPSDNNSNNNSVGTLGNSEPKDGKKFSFFNSLTSMFRKKS